MSHLPTYVSRLDPKFRRFVNVVNVYPTSPTSSTNDDKDEEATTSLASSSYSEKFPEFLAADACTEDSWLQTQGQREVSEFFVEYANVLSSGSETSFVTDDKDIATSTTSSSWRENPQNVSNSERRSGQDRIPSIPSDCFREDSVFLSDECDESFYDENGINYCLQKRPGVSSKRHDLNRPLSGSFSSEAGSERSYRYRNEAEVCSEDFGDNAGFLAGRYSRRKENISSVPWHRGQEVISRNPQDTSRKMDDSFDDCYSVDSECYSPDIVEDGYSSTSSADSSFVCFALVGKQEDERMKRKIGSNVGQRDRHKKHRPRRREPEEKDSDHGVMACVVSGISGGPAIRVFRDDDSQKSIARSKRRELEHPRKIKEGSPHGREVKGGATESNTLKGSQFQNERSKETSRGFVFGVFGTPDNPVLAEKQSGIDDGKPLNPERGDSSYEVEDAEPYDGRFTAFPENSLKTKPCDEDYFPQATKPKVKVRSERTEKHDEYPSHCDSVDGNRIFERVSDKSSNDYGNPRDNMVAITNADRNTSDYRSFGGDKLNNISNSKPLRASEEINQSGASFKKISSETYDEESPPDEQKPLSYLERQTQMTDVNEDCKDRRLSENENDPMTRDVTDGEDKELSCPLQLHSSGLREPARDIRINSIGRSPQDRRPRRRLKEKEQQRLEPEKVVFIDAKKNSEEKVPSCPHGEHELREGRFEDLFEPDKAVKMCSLPFYSATCSAFDPENERQESQTTRDLESTTGDSLDETLLITDGVQKNMLDEYSAAEVKTELLTPVKQTIHEFIQASFLDNDTSGTEWKMSPNEDDRVRPEGRRDGTFGTEVDSEKHKQPGEEQTATMEITEGLQPNVGNIHMKEDVPGHDPEIDHREKIPKQDYAVLTLENKNKNTMAKKTNSGIGQECDAGYDYHNKDHADGVKNNDECDLTDRDMNDDFDEHDRRISASAKDFSESSEEESGFSAAASTDESVNTIDPRKPDSMSCPEREVVSDLESKGPFDAGYPQPMEETSGDLHSVNHKVSLLRKADNRRIGDGFSSAFDSQPKIYTHEAKRKQSEDDQETGHSKKRKSVSETLTKGDDHCSQFTDDFRSPSIRSDSRSGGKSFDRREERLATAIELPGRSLEEAQPFGKEKEGYFSTKKDRRSRARALESFHSIIMDSIKTTESVETLRPGLSPEITTGQGYDGTKNVSSVPVLSVDHNVAATAVKVGPQDGLATAKIYGRFYSKFNDKSTTTLSEETPNQARDVVSDMPTILNRKQERHPYEDVERTDLSDETQHPFMVTVDTSPSVSVTGAEFGSYYREDTRIAEVTESHNDKVCVAEDVCLVAFDDNRQSEDGAWNAAEIMSSNNCNEPTVFSMEPNSEILDEGNEGNAFLGFLTESEMDSSEGPSREINVTDNVLILDERKMRDNDVDEVVCSYEEHNCLPQTQNLTNSENSYSVLESDVGNNLWPPAAGVPDEDTPMNDSKERNGSSVNDPGWISCNQFNHCGCLQGYLLHIANQDAGADLEKERNCNKEPVAFAAELQKLNMHPNLDDVEDAERFGTVRINRYHTDASVKEVFDQQCQVELLKECRTPPEHKTKECQTPFSYSTINKECQTNESIESFLIEVLQQQNVECQTELLTDFCASCGVIVENVCDKQIQVGQDEKCRYTDKDCQTLNDYGLILTSSKQCQTVSLSEDPFSFTVDHNNVKLEGIEESRYVSFENKECQTSENYLLSFGINNENATKEVGSCDPVFFENKECQTSCEIVLVTSSAQCDILHCRDDEEVLSAKGIEASRLPSYDNKECQTLLDNDLLLAMSKHCQTSSWSYTSDDMSRASYDSKECQTLPESSLPLTSSKECQTLAEFTSDVGETTDWFQTHQSVSYNSKECQTTSHPMNNQDNLSPVLFGTMEVDFSAQSTQTEDIPEKNMPTYESKESQTTPDQDLLLSSSKVCQTMKLEPAIAFENRETQTLPDGDMFLTSSTECQTEPYRLDDVDSMPPDLGLKGSQDIELSDDANVGEYPDTHSSPQMASRNRPATYGKSPEETEESFFGFQANGDMDATELCQTNVKLASRPLGSALTIDVSEKGCQAMLCSCGNCADDQESAGASSVPQKGYFFH